MKQKIFLLALAVLLAGHGPLVRAQEVAVKTNVIADALQNVNLGVEVGLAPKWSLDVTGEFNGWTLSHGRRWKHWYAMPELRYWLCDRMSGHFFALHTFAGQYNIGGFDGKWNILGTDATKLKNFRYQGWFAGAGLGYGYAWPLAHHLNLEAEIGIGWSYSRYDSYRCANCGKKVESNQSHNFVGPTKAALNLVYVF